MLETGLKKDGTGYELQMYINSAIFLDIKQLNILDRSS